MFCILCWCTPVRLIFKYYFAEKKHSTETQFIYTEQRSSFASSRPTITSTCLFISESFSKQQYNCLTFRTLSKKNNFISVSKCSSFIERTKCSFFWVYANTTLPWYVFNVLNTITMLCNVPLKLNWGESLSVCFLRNTWVVKYILHHIVVSLTLWLY